jgi:hypothetical protein
MSIAATVLGGAKSRLLPPSIPFRFFAAAAGFHVLMWLVLLTGAGNAASFRGGLGSTLAAVHLLVLGVLVTTVVGASVQLLPVATRRALVAIWPIKLVFWLTIPGMVALIAGMYSAQINLLIPGAAVTAVGLLLFGGLLADNLRRAQSLPIVAAYGWAALAALGFVVALGVALAINEDFEILPNHSGAALAHLILGGFGFMGLLALGFSHILVPMFALAAAPPKRSSLLAFALAVVAILLGSLGALANSSVVLTIAAFVGIAAAGLHVHLMLSTLKAGMRKRLGLSFVLIRAAWLMLFATPIAGIAAIYGLAGPNGATLFGLLLFGGWLMTFLLGVLERILPFLASMHASRPVGGMPPLMPNFAESTLLRIHATCHAAALTLLAVAITTDTTWLMRVGSAVGLVGALVFAWFSADVMRRMASPRQ